MVLLDLKADNDYMFYRLIYCWVEAAFVQSQQRPVWDTAAPTAAIIEEKETATFSKLYTIVPIIPGDSAKGSGIANNNPRVEA